MAKRETNKERRVREDRRRALFEMATEIATSIDSRRCFSSIPEEERKSLERGNDFLDLTLWTESQSKLRWGIVDMGAIENIAKALRLAADKLEGKPEDGRRFSDHDRKIAIAFFLARARTTYPTFSEFIEVYRKRNPKVRVEERTLRRSLQRLGLTVYPARRGRPKGK